MNFVIIYFFIINIEWMGFGRKGQTGWQVFLAANIRPLHDGKWIWEKVYQYTNAKPIIGTGASCQKALGCVLLEQSSQALRGLLKEESEIEAGMLAVERHAFLGDSWKQQGGLVFPFCLRSSDKSPGILILHPLAVEL